MRRRWYVVGNASRARVIECTDGRDGWVDIADLVHAQSRLPAAALASDRPGHVVGHGDSHGNRGASFSPRTDPRQHEHERFADEIARVLDTGLAQGRYDELVLVVSNPFFGVLRGRLGEQTVRRISATSVRDWTKLPPDELIAKLRADPLLR